MTNKYGITGFGGYIPRLRMQRSAIFDAHKWMAPSLKSYAKGTRAFCSWDEDIVTMAVEAARDALGRGQEKDITSLRLASTNFPYDDLQNSSIVASALALPKNIMSMDIGHSQRAATSGLLAALAEKNENTLFIASDNPLGKPASNQEMIFGAAAAAFVLGSENIIAEMIGHASASNFFADHFRNSQSKFDYYWEERWVRDEGYSKIVPPVFKAALENAAIAVSDISKFILASQLKGTSALIAKKLGVSPEALVDGLDSEVGYSGTAHALVMLSHVLETAKAGEIIAVVGFGQGADVIVFKVTDKINNRKPKHGISQFIKYGQTQDSYLRMLSYSGSIELEWGMRAEKNTKTALTEQYRSSHQLAHFVAGKCNKCGTIQFPQLQYCANPECHAPASEFAPHSLVDDAAKVLTFTADSLSYHPSTPLYVGFVQFENGARLLMEMVEVDPDKFDVGTDLRMVFRIKEADNVRGYARYFWKATPIQKQEV